MNFPGYYCQLKEVYPYEYITRWEKFERTVLPEIETFYIQLRNYKKCRERIQENANVDGLGEYHDLFVTSTNDANLSIGIFESLRLNEV